MSTSTLTMERRTARWLARCGDYVELTKPRIAMMVLITVAVAAHVGSWGQSDPVLVIHALVGTLLVSASASAWNQWLERFSDRRMLRTAGRPLPSGRLSSWQVVLFAALTGVIGTAYLAWAVNLLTALLGLLTWVVYVVIYTPLKSRSPLNTVVGAVSGALPMSIGWAAVGGSLNPWVDPRGLALVLIVFFWQFPHFMAIAWLYRDQYGRAGSQMLTVVDPSGRRAAVQAVSATLALLPVSLVPALFAPGAGAVLYMLAAFVLGSGLLACAALFMTHLSEATARLLLRASLIYLPALLAFLVFIPWV